jgi:hypothetical protein
VDLRRVACASSDYSNPALYTSEDAVSGAAAVALLWPCGAAETESPTPARRPAASWSQFSLSSYWDARYEREGGAAFEWYRSYDSLQPILERHLHKDKPVLHVGVGTSRIQVRRPARRTA